MEAWLSGGGVRGVEGVEGSGRGGGGEEQGSGGKGLEVEGRKVECANNRTV